MLSLLRGLVKMAWSKQNILRYAEKHLPLMVVYLARRCGEMAVSKAERRFFPL